MKRYVEIFQEKRAYIPPAEPTTIIGACVQFYYKDSPNEVEHGYFSFGAYCDDRNEDSFGVSNDLIYYYCNGQGDLDRMKTGSKEEFVVVGYQLERCEVGGQQAIYVQ